MPNVITCPECGDRMRVPDAARGKKVRCTGCQVVLAISDRGAAAVAAASQASAAARRPMPSPDDDEERPSAPRPARRRRAGRGSRVSGQQSMTPWITGAVGAIVLLVMIVVGFAVARRFAQPGGAGVNATGNVAEPAAATFNAANYPPLPAARKVEPGVLVHELSFAHGRITRQIWIYLPEKPAGSSLPCVLVAPAGSPLIYGMELGDGDRAEHLPYVRAGLGVVSYSIDGHLDERAKRNETALVAAVTAFKGAGAGVANAREALEYALAQVPALDRRRIYTAGHSSAATLSLQVAEHEPRVKACIAYAPVTNVIERTPAQAVDALARVVPGFREFLTDYSPHTHMDRLRCPVFLFHAEDDSNVPIRQSADFAARLKTTNPRVTFVRARSGDHYNSMIGEGIPQAIRWLKQLPAE